MRGVWLMTLALLASCAPEDPGQVPENGIERMSARQQLIRVSVDLRGIHPTEDELAFIEEQPWAYDEFVDRYIADERFLDRVEEIFNYRYLTRTGETYFDDWDELALGAVDERRLAESIANEPLKLLRYTVDNDLPYSYVITANHTMSDPLLAEAWRLDYPDGEEGWQMAQYQDGRPMAGILSMTTTWVRYPSAGVNGNRHRANQMSRLFLCDDYLSRPVSFSRSQVDALTTGDPNDVIANTPTCQSCHSSLDPLAAHFFGFWWEVEGGVVDQTTYRQEDEEFYRDYGRRSMAYYGVPTANISEMAGHLAEDPRFADCAVQTVFDGLTQRTTSDADWSELRGHRDAFMAGDMNIKDLVRSIVTSEEYRARAIDPDVNNDDLDERVQNVKMVTPAMLSSVIADKTGYRWQFDGRDGLAKNERGLAVLSGGIDGRFVRTPSHDPSVGMVLIQERLAQAAGWHVAQTDLRIEDPEGRRLLKYVNLTDTPELNDDAFDYQIRDLYLQLTGLPLAPEATEPAELKILWKQLYSLQNSPEAAWAGIVSVVLRDPLVLFY